MIAGDPNIRERLIVAQQHVVARQEALDQVALEQQRLDLGMGGDDFDPDRGGDHALQAARQPVGLGVGGDAFFEVLGLADIECLALAVEHAVDARRTREGLDRGRDRRHAQS